MDWLILRDVLNTACNIKNIANKEVGGEWKGRVGVLTMPSDTGDYHIHQII